MQLKSFAKLFNDRRQIGKLQWQDSARDYLWHGSCRVEPSKITSFSGYTYDDCWSRCESNDKERAGCGGFRMQLDRNVDSPTLNEATCFLHSSSLTACVSTATEKKVTSLGWFVAGRSVSVDYTRLGLAPVSVVSYQAPAASLRDCHALCHLYRDCGVVRYISSNCYLYTGLQLASSGTSEMRLVSTTAYSSVGNGCKTNGFRVLRCKTNGFRVLRQVTLPDLS